MPCMRRYTSASGADCSRGGPRQPSVACGSPPRSADPDPDPDRIGNSGLSAARPPSCVADGALGGSCHGRVGSGAGAGQAATPTPVPGNSCIGGHAGTWPLQLPWNSSRPPGPGTGGRPDGLKTSDQRAVPPPVTGDAMFVQHCAPEAAPRCRVLMQEMCDRDVMPFPNCQCGDHKKAPTD